MPLTKTEKNRRWLAKNPGYFKAWRTKNPEYACWKSMIQRCTNPDSPNYSRYGGRGITVCDRWRESYKMFLMDVGARPSLDHSIDRIDVNGNYEPSNVRWATRGEQQQNKRHGVPEDVVARIVLERSAGKTYKAIARELNTEGVPTPRNKQWYGVTVKNCAVRAALELPDE